MIAYHFPPGEETGAARPYRFARYLREFGYETHVVTAPRPDQRLAWPHSHAAPAHAASGWEKTGESVARMVQRLAPYNDQLPWAPHAVSTALRVARRRRPSIVISTAPPFATHFVGAIVKRLCNVPWVADFRDPLYGNPFRARTWGWMWDKPVEKLIAAQADALIANTDAVRDMLVARYPRHAHKIHLIWNGYDPENTVRALPIPPRSVRVLVHAGSVYGRRHPSAIVSSLERLIASGRLDPAGVRLKLVGYIGMNEAWLRECPFERLVERGCLKFTGKPVSRREAAREMALADYLVLLDVNGGLPALQVPAKLFEYIQIGRPILAFTAGDSPVRRILARSNIRHVCVHEQSPPEDVDEGILQLLAMPPEPAAASKWFFEEFDGVEQTRRLAGILDGLSAAAPASRP